MNNGSRAFIILVSFLACCVLFWFGHTIYAYHRDKHIEEETHRVASQKSLDSIVNFFEKKLAAIAAIVHHLGNNEALMHGTPEHLEQLFKSILQSEPAIYGIGIAYEPYVYNSQQRLTSFYYCDDPEKKSEKISLEQFYDYTKSAWYTDALKGKSEWTSPYKEASLNTIITRYTQPFSAIDPETGSSKIYAVIVIDSAVEHINDTLASFSIDKNSYAFITGKDGILIAHPTEHFVQEEKSIFDIAQLPGQKDFIALGNQINKNKNGSFLIRDAQAKKEYRAIYKHIAQTEWTAIVVTSQKQDFLPSISIRRSATNAVFALFLFLFLLCTLILRPDTGAQHRLWLVSIFLSILLGLSTFVMWTFEIVSTERKEFHEHIMNNSIALNRFFYVQKRLNPIIYKKNPHFIPTGLFIYAIDIVTSSSDVSFSGHIWQKYNLKNDNNLTPGFTILNAKEQSFQKIYETKDMDTHTVGWRFRATVKSNFSFTKYPFDQQNIVLELGYHDYKENVILTPDFESFSAKNSPYPEIDPVMNTGQWTTKSTYSFYQLTNYATDFGITAYAKQKNFPNLSFNILVRRKFSDPLITNFLPIAIILTIAFAIFIATGLSNEKTKDIAALVLPLSSSIFFAAAVGHQTYEHTLDLSGLTYFEYFYFMLYVIILLTTTNGMLYGYGRGGWLLTYKHNFIPRLLYWPIVLLAFLINTIIFFY